MYFLPNRVKSSKLETACWSLWFLSIEGFESHGRRKHCETLKPLTILGYYDSMNYS